MGSQTSRKPKGGPKGGWDMVDWGWLQDMFLGKMGSMNWQSSGPNLTRERITEIPVTGEVIEWKGIFGWIKPTVPIEHQASSKHKGNIYVHKKDLVGTEQLDKGAVLQFHVYADQTGLGAEEVRLF